MKKTDVLDIIYDKFREVEDKKEEMYEGEALLQSHGLASVNAKLEVLNEIAEEVEKLEDG